jgi:hypothetical protein
MSLGNDEQMPLMHRIDIKESDEESVFVDLAAGDLSCDNLAKNTIHKKPPLIYLTFYKFSKGNTTAKSVFNTS